VSNNIFSSITLFYGFASPILDPALSAHRPDLLWRARHTVLRHTTFRDVGACRASDLHAWSERDRNYRIYQPTGLTINCVS
jgi:hypothetical protein